MLDSPHLPCLCMVRAGYLEREAGNALLRLLAINSAICIRTTTMTCPPVAHVAWTSLPAGYLEREAGNTLLCLLATNSAQAVASS